ncbi:MAG: hypothetical protein M3P29_03000 [Acidobacteriota bacterium]|nr:hypothetical protein [Acidobacteriota bacterium]
MTKQSKQKPLTEDEIDAIVIAQVDDDDAWEEELSVTPVSRPSVARKADPSTNHPASHRGPR